MGENNINLISGGAGFLGSHLIEKLMSNGESVICIDNLFSGSKSNLRRWESNSNFKFIEHDITKPINLKVGKIWHMACPASPKYYQYAPIQTSKTNFLGTYNMLSLAKMNNARFLMASSSEIYGNPAIHPQPESYNGSVKSIGERSCYNEGKRIAESLCFDFKRIFKCDIKIARIFNTYGPGMLVNDGRVISNFIVQALQNRPLTIHGEGKQTRSFCYVDDLIDGLMRLMYSDNSGPINLGNPSEISILKLADMISAKINPDLIYERKELSEEDPKRRKPSIELAKKQLDWEPKISLNDGINKTITYFKNELKL